MARYTIDRFEDQEWSVLEDARGRTFNAPRDWLPGNAKEGDVLDISGVAAAGANLLRLMVDTEGREERLAKARARRDALRRGPKGDVAL